MATKYRIHPAIGIARLGNHRDFYIGPEIPGAEPQTDDGNYKKDGRTKRQAARFRVFAYDDDQPGNPPAEVNLGSAGVQKIRWTVQLANRKAASNKIFDLTEPRNPGLSAAELTIAPQAKTVDQPNVVAEFSDGAFRNVPVPLGDLRMDAQGRAIVSGGFGKSNFVLKPGEQGGYQQGGALNYDNNRYWYDDACDGFVAATIHVANGGTHVAAPAWVIVGPPDFAGISNVVTLHDVMFDVVVRFHKHRPSLFAGGIFQPTYLPSFTREVYPIFNRALQQRWVNRLAALGHASFGTLMDFSQLSVAPNASGSDPHKALRTQIFQKLRDPDNPSSTGNMPFLNGDDGAVYPTQGLTLTRTQYFVMKQWQAGKFANDWQGIPQPANVVTTAGLDQAALEHANGGSFFPGIETNRIVAVRPDIYDVDASGVANEIRLKGIDVAAGRVPGYITEHNALPWQADFLKCNSRWWPAQRPDDVIVTPGTTPVSWTRDIIGPHKDMVERWFQLGFVVKVGNDYLEKERNPTNFSLV